VARWLFPKDFGDDLLSKMKDFSRSQGHITNHSWHSTNQYSVQLQMHLCNSFISLNYLRKKCINICLSETVATDLSFQCCKMPAILTAKFHHVAGVEFKKNSDSVITVVYIFGDSTIL